MFVTFMGGTGVDQADGGSIGVFDPQSNALVQTIEARRSEVGEGEPYIMWFLAQMYARFSPQQVVHAGRRGCRCARGRYSAGKSSVAQSTAACAAPLLVGGLLGGSQLDRKVLRRWHLQGDEP